MSDNLRTVQKICHVMEVIYRVLTIICLVALICCVIGVVALSICSFFPDAKSLIEDKSSRNLMQLIGLCLAGFVISMAHFIVLKAHRDFFAMEQKAGTPFTVEGAKAFRTLGIMNIVVPIATTVVASIIGVIFKCRGDFRLEIEVGLGIAMILLSFVFAYGAELEEKKKGTPEEKKLPQA